MNVAPDEAKPSGFIILSEGTARRCEICHQTDEFDELSQTCRRCSGLVLPTETPNTGGFSFSFRSLHEPPTAAEDLQATSVIWASVTCALVFFFAETGESNILFDVVFRFLFSTFGALFGLFGGYAGGLLVGILAHVGRWREDACFVVGRITGFICGCLIGFLLLMTLFHIG